MTRRSSAILCAATLLVCCAVAYPPPSSAEDARVWLVGDSITQLYAVAGFIPAATAAGKSWQIGEYGRPLDTSKMGLCRSYMLLHRDDLFATPQPELFGYFGPTPKSCHLLEGWMGEYTYPEDEPPLPPVGETPDVVVLLFGANDLFNAQELAKPDACAAPACGALQVARRMVALGEVYEQAGAAVIMGLPLIASTRASLDRVLSSWCGADDPSSQIEVDTCLARYREDAQDYWENSKVLRKQIRRQWHGRVINFRARASRFSDYMHPSDPAGTDWMAKKAIKAVERELRRRARR